MSNAALIRTIVGIFVTIIVSAFIMLQVVEAGTESIVKNQTEIAESVATGQAQINYESLLSSCEASNPVREAVLLATRTAAEVASEGNARYAEAARKIAQAPYVNDVTGERNCKKAVQHP